MNYLYNIPFVSLCIIIRILGPTQYNKFNTSYITSSNGIEYPIHKYVDCLEGGSKWQLKILLDKYNSDVIVIKGIMNIVYPIPQIVKDANKSVIKYNEYIGKYPLNVLTEIAKHSNEYIE